MAVNLVIITQGISRVTLPILNSEHSVVGIVESAPRGYKNKVDNKLKRLVRTILNFPKSKLRKSLKATAEERGIPYYFLLKGDSIKFTEWLARLEPDVAVIYSMSQLLPAEILDIPRCGVLNLHPSSLPAYRGPNPWFWMYYHMDNRGGVTLHYVDPGEDTGDIVFQCDYEFPLGGKSPDIQDIAIGKHGVDIILEALNILSAGQQLPRTPQPAQSTTARARNIKPDEHKDIIKWSLWPIERVWHLMRGTELWLNCIEQPSGIYSGQRWRVMNFERHEITVEPRQLAQVNKDAVGYYVQCRDGIIRLEVDFNWKAYLKRVLIAPVSKAIN